MTGRGHSAMNVDKNSRFSELVNELGKVVGIGAASPPPAMEGDRRRRLRPSAREHAALRPRPDGLFREMYLAQQGRCAMKHLPLDLRDWGDRRAGQSRRRRMGSTAQAGYVRGNVRLVLQGVNFARNARPDQVLMVTATGSCRSGWLISNGMRK